MGDPRPVEVGPTSVEDLEIQLHDPARNYTGNVCGHRTNECAGDVRFYDWAKQGFGIRRPVLFTARDGATISGNVWATRSGPRVRPAIARVLMVPIESLSATLRSVAARGMTPKALRAAVRGKHPEASKKDVVRAAS